MNCNNMQTQNKVEAKNKSEEDMEHSANNNRSTKHCTSYEVYSEIPECTTGTENMHFLNRIYKVSVAFCIHFSVLHHVVLLCSN